MAQPLVCDLCQAEDAVLMQTTLTDGSSMTVGPACLPMFFGGAVLGVIGSDGHAGPPTKCQACRRIHETMTTPVAPLAAADPVPETPGVSPADIDPAAAGQ
ncbi:MAG TPA: hypothetical protein VL179_08890 [Mycobacterium sp.]|nr:hypothetical protein [Mycobacterium sp.]